MNLETIQQPVGEVDPDCQLCTGDLRLSHICAYCQNWLDEECFEGQTITDTGFLSNGEDLNAKD